MIGCSILYGNTDHNLYPQFCCTPWPLERGSFSQLRQQHNCGTYQAITKNVFNSQKGSSPSTAVFRRRIPIFYRVRGRIILHVSCCRVYLLVLPTKSVQECIGQLTSCTETRWHVTGGYSLLACVFFVSNLYCCCMLHCFSGHGRLRRAR